MFERQTIPAIVVINSWAPMSEAMRHCLGNLSGDVYAWPPSVGAYDMIEALNPALIVLDLLDVSAVELFEVLRQGERTANIPCLAIIAPPQHERLAEHLEQPGVSVLFAPFTSEELLEAARELCRR